MAYAKQTWVPYDENKSEEENIKSGAVGTAERMNHIEDGIKNMESDTDKYQKVKVTDDTGGQIGTASASVTLLQTIINLGKGLRSVAAGATATDNPSGQALRGVAIMNTSTSGNFMGMTEDGKFYARSISAGKWVGTWQKGVGTNEAQLYFPTMITTQAWNTITAPGIYYVNNASGSNAPNVSKYGYLEVISSTPTILQRYTSVNNDVLIRRYSPSTDTWSAWEIILKFSDNIQMKPITQSSGSALLDVKKGEALLDKIIANGAGLSTGVLASGVTDSPETTGTVRVMVNMIGSTGGSVTAISASNTSYTRLISSSAWFGEWQKLVPEKDFDSLVARVASLEGKAQ